MMVVAGPPGSGKSTVFRPDEAGIDYFNADERARDLNGGSGRNISPEIRAIVNKELERFIADHIQRKESFSFETTLRTTITFEQARRAKAEGFEATMEYVALNSAEESIRRVRARAEGGGHSAPPERIREIYESSLRNLPQALREFDHVIVRDNTDERVGVPSRIFETIDGAVTEIAENTPQWIEKALSGSAYEISESLRDRVAGRDTDLD